MAKRKRLSAAISGIGEGIGNTGNMMLRMHMQDRQDERARQGALAVADRTRQTGIDKLLSDLLLEAAKTGNVDPSAIASAAKLFERDLDPATLEGVNPIRRRLE